MLLFVMSHAVQVRRVPDNVHSALKRQAAAAGLSMSEYLLGEITRIATRPTISEVLEHAAGRSGGARLEDAVAAIRADRDGR